MKTDQTEQKRIARITVRRATKGRVVGWLVNCQTCGGLIVPPQRAKHSAKQAAYDHAVDAHNRDATISG